MIKKTKSYKRKHNKSKKNKFIKGGMKKHAIISQDDKYRYQLSRIWEEEKPKVLFIMLNPSTADADVDDPTIRRVVNFAKSWGYGGVFVGNLYAFRSTDPKGLRYIDNPVGEDNIGHALTGLICKGEYYIYDSNNNYFKIDWTELTGVNISAILNYYKIIYTALDVNNKNQLYTNARKYKEPTIDIYIEYATYHNTTIDFSFKMQKCDPNRPIL